MICQFGFKNFKSFKDETIFDFRALHLDELKESLILDSDGEKFLPVNVIYGPNGGGKTTLLQALSCAINTVVDPILNLHKNRIPLVFQHQVPCEPYAFNANTVNKPTEFNIYFRVNENEYRYYISLLNGEVIAESLRRRALSGKKTAVIFEREENNIELGASLNKNSINKQVNPKMPYLSFLAINYDLPIIAEVQAWFESCIIRNYANPSSEKTICLFEDDNDKSRFISAMNSMGVDMTGYRVNNDTNKLMVKRTVQNIEYELPLQKESEGTRKLFAIVPIILMALEEGRLVIVDELDAKLHPKLLKYIIKLFSDMTINKHGAQIVFTSHDLSTMKNDVFRRDEIWFSSLNKDRASTIFTLSDIRMENGKRINPTASYDKQYLEGRYGADPYLQKMLHWGEDK